ncbi:MAG: hypothetical protein ACRD0H_01690 [Actinomycetes bacterium]
MTTTMTDTAAGAAIGAATRELRLPVVRADAARLAEIAQRSQMSYLMRPGFGGGSRVWVLGKTLGLARLRLLQIGSEGGGRFQR